MADRLFDDELTPLAAFADLAKGRGNANTGLEALIRAQGRAIEQAQRQQVEQAEDLFKLRQQGAQEQLQIVRKQMDTLARDAEKKHEKLVKDMAENPLALAANVKPFEDFTKALDAREGDGFYEGLTHRQKLEVRERYLAEVQKTAEATAKANGVSFKADEFRGLLDAQVVKPPKPKGDFFTDAATGLGSGLVGFAGALAQVPSLVTGQGTNRIGDALNEFAKNITELGSDAAEDQRKELSLKLQAIAAEDHGTFDRVTKEAIAQIQNLDTQSLFNLVGSLAGSVTPVGVAGKLAKAAGMAAPAAKVAGLAAGAATAGAGSAGDAGAQAVAAVRDAGGDEAAQKLAGMAASIAAGIPSAALAALPVSPESIVARLVAKDLTPGALKQVSLRTLGSILEEAIDEAVPGAAAGGVKAAVLNQDVLQGIKNGLSGTDIALGALGGLGAGAVGGLSESGVRRAPVTPPGLPPVTTEEIEQAEALTPEEELAQAAATPEVEEETLTTEGPQPGVTRRRRQGAGPTESAAPETAATGTATKAVRGFNGVTLLEDEVTGELAYPEGTEPDAENDKLIADTNRAIALTRSPAAPTPADVNVPDSEFEIVEPPGTAAATRSQEPAVQPAAATRSQEPAVQPAPAAPQPAAATLDQPAVLPTELRGAKPRYNIGTVSKTPKFTSDIDMAMFITSQRVPSKRDAAYRGWLEGLGFSADQIAEGGKQVRARLKELHRASPPASPTFDVPAIVPRPVPPVTAGTPATAVVQPIEAPQVQPAPAQPRSQEPAAQPAPVQPIDTPPASVEETLEDRQAAELDDLLGTPAEVSEIGGEVNVDGRKARAVHMKRSYRTADDAESVRIAIDKGDNHEVVQDGEVFRIVVKGRRPKVSEGEARALADEEVDSEPVDPQALDAAVADQTPVAVEPVPVKPAKASPAPAAKTKAKAAPALTPLLKKARVLIKRRVAEFKALGIPVVEEGLGISVAAQRDGTFYLKVSPELAEIAAKTSQGNEAAALKLINDVFDEELIHAAHVAVLKDSWPGPDTNTFTAHMAAEHRALLIDLNKQLVKMSGKQRKDAEAALMGAAKLYYADREPRVMAANTWMETQAALIKAKGQQDVKFMFELLRMLKQLGKPSADISETGYQRILGFVQQWVDAVLTGLRKLAKGTLLGPKIVALQNAIQAKLSSGEPLMTSSFKLDNDDTLTINAGAFQNLKTSLASPVAPAPKIDLNPSRRQRFSELMHDDRSVWDRWGEALVAIAAVPARLVQNMTNSMRTAVQVRDAAVDRMMKNGGKELRTLMGEMVKKYGDRDSTQVIRDFGYWLTAKHVPTANRYLMNKWASLVTEAQTALIKANAKGDATEIAKAQTTLIKAQAVLKSFVTTMFDPKTDHERYAVGMAAGMNNARAAELAADIESRVDPADLQRVAELAYTLNAERLLVDAESQRATPETIAGYLQKPEIQPLLQELLDASRAFDAQLPAANTRLEAARTAVRVAVRNTYVPLTGDAATDVNEGLMFSGSRQPNTARTYEMLGAKQTIPQDGISTLWQSVVQSASYAGWAPFQDAVADVYHSLSDEDAKKLGIAKIDATALHLRNDNVLVRRRGQTVSGFLFSNPKMMQSLRNANAEEIGDFWRWASKPNRVFSYFITQLNVLFQPFRNVPRDFNEKTELIRTRTYLDKNGKVLDSAQIANHALGYAPPWTFNPLNPFASMHLGKFGTNLKLLWNFAFTGEIDTSLPEGRYLKELLAHGGLVGFSQHMDRSQEALFKSIAKGESIVLKNKHMFFSKVENMNRAWELMSGLATYVAMRENGMTAKDAAPASLDLMDFTKRGHLTPMLSALWAFARPSAIGTANLITALWNPHTGKMNPRAWARLGAMTLSVTALRALMLLMAGGDDDDEGGNKLEQQSDFLHENFLLIPVGDGALKLPIGHGMMRLANTMALTALGYANRDDSVWSILGKTTGRTISVVAPLNMVDTDWGLDPFRAAAVSLAPSQLRPWVSLGTNMSSFGSEIYNKRWIEDGELKSEEINPSISETYHTMAKELRRWTGVDMHPNQVKELMRSYMWGPMVIGTDLLVDNPKKVELGRDTKNYVADQVYAGYNEAAPYFQFKETLARAKLLESRQLAGDEMDEDDQARILWRQQWEEVDAKLQAKTRKVKSDVKKGKLSEEAAKARNLQIQKEREIEQAKALFDYRTLQGLPTTWTQEVPRELAPISARIRREEAGGE